MSQLPLKKYFSLIYLYDEFVPTPTIQTKTEYVVDDLLKFLLQETDAPKDVQIPNDYVPKRNLLRGLLNIREPKPLNREFLKKLDSLLQTELQEKGIVEVDKLDSVSTLFPNNPFTQSDKFVLWQGDITRLNANAIVNAANKQMLGCLKPYMHVLITQSIQLLDLN